MTGRHRTILGLSASLLAATATADTITVCLDGTCDFTDPAAAAAVATSGDVIEIAAGTYLLDEPVVMYGPGFEVVPWIARVARDDSRRPGGHAGPRHPPQDRRVRPAGERRDHQRFRRVRRWDLHQAFRGGLRELRRRRQPRRVPRRWHVPDRRRLLAHHLRGMRISGTPCLIRSGTTRDTAAVDLDRFRDLVDSR